MFSSLLSLPLFAGLFSKQEERYLRRAAAQKLHDERERGTQARYFVYGHTHDPDIWQMGQKEAWYYNTGTWTKVLSWEERLSRRPEQFVFLKIVRDAVHNSGWQSKLYYWDSKFREQKSLVLEEDSRSMKLKWRNYLSQAGLKVPEPSSLEEQQDV